MVVTGATPTEPGLQADWRFCLLFGLARHEGQGMRVIQLIFVLSGLFAGGVASAQAIEAGTYLCGVEQRAGISSTHIEGAGPPRAHSDAEHYRFRIAVAAVGDTGQLRIVELPYDGPDRFEFQP
jgi:hypothetical protein